MSGLQNAKQPGYAKRFDAFCANHGLDYSQPARLATLTAALLNKSEVDAEFAPLKQLAIKTPESLYVEIMHHMASVDPQNMARLDPTVVDLTVAGATAKGTAVRSDGRTLPVPFLKTSAGWMITE